MRRAVNRDRQMANDRAKAIFCGLKKLDNSTHQAKYAGFMTTLGNKDGWCTQITYTCTARSAVLGNLAEFSEVPRRRGLPEILGGLAGLPKVMLHEGVIPPRIPPLFVRIPEILDARPKWKIVVFLQKKGYNNWHPAGP